MYTRPALATSVYPRLLVELNGKRTNLGMGAPNPVSPICPSTRFCRMNAEELLAMLTCHLVWLSISQPAASVAFTAELFSLEATS